MFIDRLINGGNAPIIEQVMKFTAARQEVLAENVANVDTPGYAQKDLSVESFQKLLRDRVDERERSESNDAKFDDVMGELSHPKNNILFHDRNNRSVEQLMTDAAKNALTHNLMVEFMRKQFSSIEMALKEKIG